MWRWHREVLAPSRLGCGRVQEVGTRLYILVQLSHQFFITRPRLDPGGGYSNRMLLAPSAPRQKRQQPLNAFQPQGSKGEPE